MEGYCGYWIKEWMWPGLDGWLGRWKWMGARYILEMETNRLSDILPKRNERKGGIKNDSWVFALGQEIGSFSDRGKSVGRTTYVGRTIKKSILGL